MEKLSILVILGMLSFMNIACMEANAAFNVLNYGAISGDTKDNSRAFLEAWKAACGATRGNPTVLIPRGMIFLVNPLVFKGPCKSTITFQVDGEIIAPASPSAWNGLDQGEWMVFSDVTSGLSFGGSGKINGRGKGWWDQSCRDHHGLVGCTSLAPTAVKFISCNDVSIKDIHFVDSAQAHLSLMGCNSVFVSNLEIVAPELSPNTDGIHIHRVCNVTITNSKIGSGDDCVSIGDYTSDVKISHVKCGPGHGISIGSLGKDGNEVKVENIHVSDVNFTGTTNGARIKTWQVGTGNVRDVTFENLHFKSVENPIMIDQNYCARRGACAEKQTGVRISNVTYKGLVGTSGTPAAITLNCSRAVPCTGLVLDSIKLVSNVTGRRSASDCSNAYGTASGNVRPTVSCLHN